MIVFLSITSRLSDQWPQPGACSRHAAAWWLQSQHQDQSQQPPLQQVRHRKKQRAKPDWLKCKQMRPDAASEARSIKSVAVGSRSVKPAEEHKQEVLKSVSDSGVWQMFLVLLRVRETSASSFSLSHLLLLLQRKSSRTFQVQRVLSSGLQKSKGTVWYWGSGLSGKLFSTQTSDGKYKYKWTYLEELNFLNNDHDLQNFCFSVSCCPGFVDPQPPDEERRWPGRGSAPQLLRPHAGRQADLQRGRCRHAQHPVRVSPGKDWVVQGKDVLCFSSTNEPTVCLKTDRETWR